ncbi:FAD-binding oxidoreductase [Phaeovulum sp. NW3]|uniref:FAD-binding oxidoreductase n=1 Tax=Phaeovulum sp. NW3 TaxID=2934933 RepID=UPI0020224555|nr:FAD-binding oxidoreductase [Phaeovulum sp. NW3]MCL7466280.1 FAD-binding oxidoreductase [Phaeovulum sp. NW3]
MSATDPIPSLRAALPDLELSQDGLDLYSTDVFYRALHLPLAVARPNEIAQVLALVDQARKLRLTLMTRGAGLSYSAGYLAPNDRTVLVDMQGMNRITELNVEDRFVTVQPGVTWSQLREALAPHGLTTPFWGTFSGQFATVGASVSQGAKFFGSASRGGSAESVLGLKVVTGTGEVLTTGAAASTEPTAPFFRNYGPDLTGPFLGDTGAFGIKVEITLVLIPAAQAMGYGTFSFADPKKQMEAMGRIGAEMLATECQGMDPFSARARLASEGLTKDVGLLWKIMRNSGGVVQALRNGATIALNGRRFAKGDGYLMNVVCEGRDTADAQSRIRRVRQIAASCGGRELPSSIPRALRAMPFPPMDSLLTPSGKRMNWLHVVVPNSLGAKCFEVTERIFERNAGAMKAAGIDRGYLLSTHGPTAVGVETLLRWGDAPLPIHTHYMSDPSKVRKREDNPASRAVLEQLSAEILQEWRALGGVHMQIGKKYPYLETRLPETAGLLRDLKARLDPDGIINTGNVFVG